MKILVFGDTHGDIRSLEEAKRKASKVDLTICLGDLTYFGENIELLLQYLESFPTKVVLLHGNHEDEELLEELSKSFKNIKFSHGEVLQINDFFFITYGGDGFSRIDPFFDELTNEISAKISEPEKSILILHGPPFDTELDAPMKDYHSGNVSYRFFIEQFQPLISFSGHIHETFKKKDKIGETHLLNPGPDGEIIDLKELLNKRKEIISKKINKKRIKNKN